MMKLALARHQRNALLSWAAEGLRLREINERAAQFDPPFEVEYLQLKHARKRSKTKFEQLREEFENEAIGEGLARKAVRIREKSHRHDLLNQIIAERSVSEDMQTVAGGKTGLLVKDYKSNGLMAVYKLDAALLKELRDLEREIAIEVGQWTEKRELTGAGGESLLDPLVAALEKAYGKSEK